MDEKAKQEVVAPTDEGQTQVSVDDLAQMVAELKTQNDKLVGTNDRLLKESKTNSEKYRVLRDKAVEAEKDDLEKSGKIEELLLRERDEKTELSKQLVQLRTTALKAKLNAEVTRYSVGVDPEYMDDVFNNVVKSDLVEVNDDELTITGVKEAVEALRQKKPRLFAKAKVDGMVQGAAVTEPPKSKSLGEMSSQDLNGLLLETLRKEGV